MWLLRKNAKQNLSLRQFAALNLLAVGSFFYLSYGLANYWASTRVAVPSVVFAWEQHIPFLSWTIWPYWSINLLYALSFFLCQDKHQLTRHVARLLTAQVIAVSCFVLFPLRFSFPSPNIGNDGATAWLFTALRSFDQPYNQAPSLHIALALILWDFYRRRCTTIWTQIVAWCWMLLICASVLSTYQHHFIDIPTGAYLGALCVWLWPLTPQPSQYAIAQTFRRNPEIHTPAVRRLRWRLACYYLVAAGLIGIVALSIGGWGLWLMWVSAALALVALIYLLLGAQGFRTEAVSRSSNHESTWASWLLFLPYFLGARLNQWLWTRQHAPYHQILPGIYLGQFPNQQILEALWAQHNSPLHVVALCPELAYQASPSANSNTGEKAWIWHTIPCLDLLPLEANCLGTVKQIIDTISNISSSSRSQPIYLCCALGVGRSAQALVAYLCAKKIVANAEEGWQLLQSIRPQVRRLHH